MLPSRRAEDLLTGWWQLICTLGGVPRLLVWDGESEVGRWRRGRSELTAEAHAFRGCWVPGSRSASRPTPRPRGLVERANGYLETSFLPGRTFTGPDDFNSQLAGWAALAKTRVKRVLGYAPAERVAADRERMLTLPPVPSVTGWAHTLRLPRDHYVRVDGNDYSVHPVAVGRRVAVSADLDRVRVVCEGRLVADHPRCLAPNRQRLRAPGRRQRLAVLPPPAPAQTGAAAAAPDQGHAISRVFRPGGCRDDRRIGGSPLRGVADGNFHPRPPAQGHRPPSGSGWPTPPPPSRKDPRSSVGIAGRRARLSRHPRPATDSQPTGSEGGDASSGQSSLAHRNRGVLTMAVASINRQDPQAAPAAAAATEHSSGAPTGAEVRYLVMTVAFIGAGWLVGWLLYDSTAGDVKFVPPKDISVFGAFYLLAQAIERVMEPFSNLVGAEDKSSASSNSTRLSKNRLITKRDIAVANARSAPTDNNAQALAERQTRLDQCRANSSVVLWGAGSALALVLVGAVGLLMLPLVGVRGAPPALDILITGLAIGGGTKPLHDLIVNIKKSKENKQNPGEVTHS